MTRHTTGTVLSMLSSIVGAFLLLFLPSLVSAQTPSACSAYRSGASCTTNHRQLQAVVKPASAGTSGSGIMLGVFVYDPALGGSAPWNPAVIDNFIAMVGGKPGAWHWFAPLSYDFTSANFDAVDSRGMTPILSWAPEVSNAAIVSGQKDAAIRKFAQDAKAWGKPFYLRLGWEMNYPEIGPWAVGVEGNTSADFVAMWKHVHDIFTAEGATNVRWFWCPGQIGIGPSFDSMYPGDAYVDVVGFDAYNWGNLRHWATWQSLAEVYGPTYNTIAALTQKPMIIGETGSPEGSGDKAAWIRQGFLTDLKTKFPRIIGVVYFNKDEARVNTSDASLNAFKEVVASPLYQGKLP